MNYFKKETYSYRFCFPYLFFLYYISYSLRDTQYAIRIYSEPWLLLSLRDTIHEIRDTNNAGLTKMKPSIIIFRIRNICIINIIMQNNF